MHIKLGSVDVDMGAMPQGTSVEKYPCPSKDPRAFTRLMSGRKELAPVLQQHHDHRQAEHAHHCGQRHA